MLNRMELSHSRSRRTTTTASVVGPVETPKSRSSAEKVDIIVHCLLSDGSFRHETNLTSHSALRAFLKSPPSNPTGQYFLSIEDISDEVAKDLSDCLNVQAEVFKDHTRGRLDSDGSKHDKDALHSEQLVSTLLGRASAKEDNYSITWWKLCTHSLSKYSFEIEALTESGADATKIVVPHFDVQISNTRRSVGSTKDQVAQVKSGAKEFLRQWKKTKEEAKGVTKELAEETICTLYSNTYRAHQVISEARDNKWGSASEERLTHFKAESNGSIFYIFLFDRERTLQENKRTFETDYTNAKNWGVLDGVFSTLGDSIQKPVTQMIGEEIGALIQTFLARGENNDRSISTPTQPERESGTPRPGETSSVLDASSSSETAFDNSTRHRFLEHISSQAPLELELRGSKDSINLPILRVKLALTSMIAQDWDSVLSQMGQTLDDIDRKISDNTDLRKNVLAWRRLLGSWRMTVIEYKAKLIETNHFLKSRISHNASELASILSLGETSRTSSPDSTPAHLIPRSIDSELKDLIVSYETLEEAIKVIEIRVDKSFQALMSSMSILESQKAITQGSAVARLTELAFIFIPLNFACTFFSMQIKEFQGPSAPSIVAFFALAVPLMLFLYTLRAFIRSSLLRKIKHLLDTKIRDESKIPGTSEIPTRVIISFGWRQLGPFSRALLIVVPLAIVILVLILKLGQWLPFRVVGSVVTVIGTLVIIFFLAIESYVPALQAGTIVGWIISMLGIGLGRVPHLNLALMGLLCNAVTIVFLTALAFIPHQKFTNPREKAALLLFPLWFVELPIAIICHYYNIARPRWELWILLLAIFSVFIVFGIIVGFVDFVHSAYCSIPELAAIAAFSIGLPMAMVWSYSPNHGNHLPLYGSIIVTFASVAAFLYLLDVFSDESTLDEAKFLIAMCVFVAVPIALIWDTLPAHHIEVQRWVQISVTCGSNVLFAMFIEFGPYGPYGPYFSLDSWKLATLLSWASTAAWLPALLWAGRINAFKGLTQNHKATIAVTCTSILFWTVIWILVYVSRRRGAR